MRRRGNDTEIKNELAAYFTHEDIGPPAINPQPRAGTSSLEPKPPQWGPGADPVLMAVVKRRLDIAQDYTTIRVYAALRARYGIVNARDNVIGDQAKDPHWARQIDAVEALYADVRDRVPMPSRRSIARARLDALWDRVFGA